MNLAITQQWDESFGYYDIQMNFDINYDENNLSKYINYFKKKKFVTYIWNRDEDGIEQTVFDFILLFEYLNSAQLRVPIRTDYDNYQNKYKLYIVREYTFVDRNFCSINQNFEMFISKCKKYYSQKLNYCKQIQSPKLILNRQIYGKPFKFKFNNANSA